MPKETIEIIIAPDGGIKIDAMNFQGADCEKATAYLEEALGVAGGRKRKPEYTATRKAVKQQKVGGS